MAYRNSRLCNDLRVSIQVAKGKKWLMEIMDLYNDDYKKTGRCQ